MADETPFNVEVNKEQVPAQVTGPPQDEKDKVDVHETSVTTDKVITDTSDPLAVQVPDEGRGDPTTPINRDYEDAEHHEDVFDREASQPSEPDESPEPDNS